MVQTILSSKKSTNGSPYAFYTVSVTPSNRKSTTVDLQVQIDAQLQYAESWLGTGFTLYAELYVPNVGWVKTILKSDRTSWSGTTKRTVYVSTTATGLDASDTAITGVLFRVTTSNSSYKGATLGSTACNNISIDNYNAASTWSLNKSSVDLDSFLTASITPSRSTNYHNITAQIGSNPIQTLASNVGSSAKLVFDKDIFGYMFGIDVKAVNCTLTLITYDSSGAELGTSIKTITIQMTQDVCAPKLSLLTQVIESNGCVITLSEPETMFSAEIESYTISASQGTVSRNGNVITSVIDPKTTQGVVAITVFVTDSRGFSSTPIVIAYSLEAKKLMGYISNGYKKLVSYVYIGGEWKKTIPFIFQGKAWRK